MQNKKITTSLNISTYNWPEALNLCLLSVKALKVLPDEVIIADDGSKDNTRQLVEKFQADFPVPIKHVWQPDEGFQLAKIRNKGIAASSGDYIIQIDGDLILHPMFVADHIAFSKKGSFASGSRVMVDLDYSQRLLRSEKPIVNIFDKDVRNKTNGIRLRFMSNYLAERYRINDMLYMRGCNMAFWREDLLKVNGYNEEFSGWGREDNEVAVRLMNSGISKRIIKFGGVVFHIYHPEKSRSGLDRNDDILQDAIVNKKKFSKIGLDQYL